MKFFFSTLPRNILGCFKGRVLVWHVIAILLTLVLVASGFDWAYFVATRSPIFRYCSFPAVVIGALLPIALPFSLLAVGLMERKRSISLLAWAIGQAEAIGAGIAALYKALTGRAHPLHDIGTDLSHTFRFGFLRGGVFWGWPSSHTTIAFAMAATMFTLLPKQKWLGYLAFTYALYVGVGVSMTIHWFSDFVAGAIYGTIIGQVVGKRFLEACANAKANLDRGFRDRADKENESA